MSRSSNGRRRSLSALEVLLRQVRNDRSLDGHEEVRANLLTRIRGLQREKLDQDGQDVAVGQILNRRALLMMTPAGMCGTVEGINLQVRLEEQTHKAQSAQRRRSRGGRWGPSGKRRLPPMRPIATRQPEDETNEDDNGQDDRDKAFDSDTAA